MNHNNITERFSALEIRPRTAQADCSEGLAIYHDNFSVVASGQTSTSLVSGAGKLRLDRFKKQYLRFTIDSFRTMETLLSSIGLAVPDRWRDLLRYYIFSLTYTSTTHQLYQNTEQVFLANIKRRLKVVLPIAAFQLQTASLPVSVILYPIIPCKSQIFKLCSTGNVEIVRTWLDTRRESPFVVNQHGENLLHVSNPLTYLYSD